MNEVTSRTQRKALVLGDDVRSLISVVRSLGRGGIEVHAAGYPDQSPVKYSRFLRKGHALPRFEANNDQWLAAIQALMRSERYDLVIPCSDPLQIPLQRFRRELEPLGRLYLLSDEVFNAVNDKNAMNRLARTAGVPVPNELMVKSVEGAAAIHQQFTLPVVLKPVSSFDMRTVGARQAVRKAYSWQEFDEILATMLEHGPVAVQENFIGQGVGVEFLLDDGRPLLEFQHVRLHEPLHGGGSYYRKGVAVDAKLRDAALSVLAPMRYTGVAMVEFKVHPASGTFAFMEVNGRFWGSLPLAVASGADFPLALFESLVDGRTTFPKKVRLGLCCRYWTGDWRWQIANLRADHSDRTLATVPLSRVAGETLHSVCTLRERSDTLTLDDPLPGLVEIASIASSAVSGAARKIKLRGLQNRWMRNRLRSRTQMALKQSQSLLFVCYGNICRSPFAHYLAKQLFGTEKTIVSSGYYPESGRHAPTTAVAAAAQLNVDLSCHRSTLLTEEQVKGADAIFVFDYSNYERVTSDFKSAKGKVYFLGALCSDEPLWITDPFGHDVERFSQTYDRISQALRTGVGEAKI